MPLAIELTEDRALHQQIADALRQRIEVGDVPVGDRLPTSRSLAKEIGVSRTTVVRAYEQLAREGWVEGRVGQGTVVVQRAAAAERADRGVNWDLLVTSRTCAPQGEFNDLLRLLSRPGLISFAGGLPAPEHFPMVALQQVTADVLRHEDPRLFQWCPVEGYPPLRSWIAERVNRDIDDVLVLTGSTQGIHLLGQSLVDPGDVVVVEAPTYPGALSAFRYAGAQVIGVPCGAGGMDIDALRNILKDVHPKLIYTIPTFHNPTGGTMLRRARDDLLQLVAEHRVPLVEDDPYSLLRYDGASLPHLVQLDRSGYVVHLSTFSKVLTPGLRVGWLVGDAHLIQRLSATRNVIDLFVNSLAQASLYRFCQRGQLDYHVRHVRPVYQERRDAMVDALTRYCPQIRFTVPDGGLFIWASLPEGISGRALLRHSVQLGVGFALGSLFYPDERGSDTLRLCFAGQSPETIADGIRKLGTALGRCQTDDSADDIRTGQGFIV